jgi:hypothetical protein
MDTIPNISGPSDSHGGRFGHLHYTIKRPAFSFLGRKYYVYAPDGSLILFLKHPVMKLRGEFTMYTDDSETTPLLVGPGAQDRLPQHGARRFRRQRGKNREHPLSRHEVPHP